MKKRRPNQASKRRLAHQALDRVIDYARRDRFSVAKISKLLSTVQDCVLEAAVEESSR